MPLFIHNIKRDLNIHRLLAKREKIRFPSLYVVGFTFPCTNNTHASGIFHLHMRSCLRVLRLCWNVKETPVECCFFSLQLKVVLLNVDNEQFQISRLLIKYYQSSKLHLSMPWALLIEQAWFDCCVIPSKTKAAQQVHMLWGGERVG